MVTPPIVVSMPDRAVIAPDDNCAITSRSCSSATRSSSTLAIDPGQVAADRFFWLERQPPVNLQSMALAAAAGQSGRCRREPVDEDRPAEVERRPATSTSPPTTGRFSICASRDSRTQPARHGDRGRAFADHPVRVSPRCGGRGPAARMFFLGAGFMLLETKGVVHMALLFGSTWMVNSIVFFAIL